MNIFYINECIRKDQIQNKSHIYANIYLFFIQNIYKYSMIKYIKDNIKLKAIHKLVALLHFQLKKTYFSNCL